MNKNVTAGHDTLVPWLLTHLCFSDCNGRVTHDGRQGLDISYNIFNLPSVVTGEDGMV
ncbi:MAG: hypothetical protein MJY67_03905 [Bacteroidales bacterium]|nr:hypothetical protein [Bacteroidales bacterium]